MTDMLDLRHILLADHDIARFATKREAAAFAQKRNWNSCDVMRAYNRFNVFWVVGERLTDNLRLATQSAGWTHVSYNA